MVSSDGTREEFELCLKGNVILIPVGAIGSKAKILWDEVMVKPDFYYPNGRELQSIISELGRENISKDQIITCIIKAIGLHPF